MSEIYQYQKLNIENLEKAINKGEFLLELYEHQILKDKKIKR